MTSPQNDPRKKATPEQLAKFRQVPPVTFQPKELNANPERGRIDSGLDEYSGIWGREQATHLIKRSLFGVRRSEVDYFSGLTHNQAIDEIISASPSPEPPINNYGIEGTEFEDPDVPLGETWINAPRGGELEGSRVQSLKGWLVGNMLNQPTTIHQKLTLFWHNLLVTQFWDVFYGKVSYKYYSMLYDNAFGNFKSLIKSLTIDPAMLFFLNGTFNNKEAPDENYARELQELFCIGKGPNAGFTESDVREASRVLTGWIVDWQNLDNAGELGSLFYPDIHDTGDKQFSSFYGNRTIQGKSGLAGADETDELLDMIFDNDETALYICRRLYNFFVYQDIDETTEANVIVPLATIFRDNNYEILPVLKALFKSEHFYDSQNFGAVIKNPADHLIGLWRTLEIDLSEFSDYELLRTHLSIIWSMSEVGMELGDPPSVSGWQAYYQEPTFDKFWINTDTVTKRALRQDSLLFPSWGHWVSEELRVYGDLPRFIETLTNPSDPNVLIDECAQLLLGISLSDEIKNGFKTILLSGQIDDFYWTDAWDLYISDKSNNEYRLVVQTRLTSFFQPFLQLAEFQLM